MSSLKKRLAWLADADPQLLGHSRHGIERECLRIDTSAQLAQTPHPQALGSALTHPSITTDYSEALLELITPVSDSQAELFSQLERIHRFTVSQLGDERLWSASMPCQLPADDTGIPIARYGRSNIGLLKYVYRRGLAVRYGKAMQCIAGIHYNYSLPPQLWSLLREHEGSEGSAQDFQSERYVAMIRNFRRYAWLLMYLFGASPAVCRSFLQGREHDLQGLSEDTLYLPWATSLRMSDLGYNNNAQAGLNVCYNSLDNYIRSMREAISQPYPPYAALGTHDADGQWQQLNTNLLQIENEFYSPIRPKRVTYSGEKPVHALAARGVEYIEVRCMDIDPFLPLGIDPSAARFLDSFLLYCALQESPLLENDECEEVAANFACTVRMGRQPGLQLGCQGEPRELREWGLALLDEIGACAAQLDRVEGGSAHADSLAEARARLENPDLTPSARVLQGIREHGDSFVSFALAQSELHRGWFLAHPLEPAGQQAFVAEAEQSVQAQAAIEAADTVDFDSFVAAYLADAGQDVLATG